MTATKREQNKIEKKERILNASFKLFAEKGLDNTSISDIVSAANIARGTFYYYYESPKDVFVKLIARHNNEINLNIKKAQKEAKTLYEFLQRSFKTYFAMIIEGDKKYFQKNNQNHIRSISYGNESILSIVSEIQKDLEGFDSINFEDKENFKLLSFVLVASASELLIGYHQFKFNTSPDKMADFLAKLFTEGIQQNQK